MTKLILSFLMGNIVVSSHEHDDHLLSQIERAYQVSPRLSKPKDTQIASIEIKGGEPYLVFVSGEKPVQCPDIQDVILTLDKIIEQTIRALCNESLYSVHASTSVVGNSAACFIGESGVGKTTMALQLARIGNGFLGDEYAWFDWRHGMVEHEPYPIHVKDIDAVRDRQFPFLHTRIEGCDGSSINLVNPNEVGVRCASGRKRLGCLVFPSYSPRIDKAVIKPAEIAFATERLLTSTSHYDSNTSMLSNMLHMISQNRIVLLSAAFSDALDAAAQIRDILVDRQLSGT